MGVVEVVGDVEVRDLFRSTVSSCGSTPQEWGEVRVRGVG